MSLKALHRHRRWPAAAALLGMVLYAGLVASHGVSQATSFTPEPVAAESSVQAAATGLRSCHEPDFAAGDPDTERHSPTVPKTKCPFCVGYAALHITILGGASFVAYTTTIAVPPAHAHAKLFSVAASHGWRPRGPPTA